VSITLVTELSAKRLEILKEIILKLRRVVTFYADKLIR
jgi:hypothetical protein